jgi:Skp family chaperone for outer membrane proteins
MPPFRPIPLAVAALVAGLATWGIARAASDPPSPLSSPEPAAKPRFARVDLRSIVGHAPFREAQLERQKEILERYRPAIDSCRQEMDAIVEEWEKLPEHDEIPPQLEDRTEETLARWNKARQGLITDSLKFADEEAKPLRLRLKTLLEDAARRGGYEAVVQMPREGGGATWGSESADDPDFGETQAVVWCRDCPDLTDELAEVVGLPDDAWVEDSAFRRAAIEFMRDFESYAEPPPWEWSVAPVPGEGEEAE